MREWEATIVIHSILHPVTKCKFWPRGKRWGQYFGPHLGSARDSFTAETDPHCSQVPSLWLDLHIQCPGLYFQIKTTYWTKLYLVPAEIHLKYGNFPTLPQKCPFKYNHFWPFLTFENNMHQHPASQNTRNFHFVLTWPVHNKKDTKLEVQILNKSFSRTYKQNMKNLHCSIASIPFIRLKKLPYSKFSFSVL